MNRRRVAKLHREFCQQRNLTAEAQRARAYARSLTDADLHQAIAKLEQPDPTREAELHGLSLRDIAREWRMAIERS